MTLTRFYLPTRLIFGAGSLSQLGKEAARLGRSAVVVSGRSSMRRTGVLDRVTKELGEKGISVSVFDRIEPNPHADTVDEGGRLVRRVQADLVIGLGGGSAMDAAKGIALVAGGLGSIRDYIAGRAAPAQPVPSLLMVPTVAASGSEANNVAVINDAAAREKRAIRSNHFFPKVSIIDPELTLTLPPQPTAQGGVDIFCHLVEEYITAADLSSLSDGIMETAMRMVVRALPRALARPEDIRARIDLSWASTIACSQFTTLGGGAGSMTLHGIEHPISAYYDVAHGDGLAALLPAWMRYTLPVTEPRFQALGRHVFRQKDGIPATEAWLERVGMWLGLGGLGVSRERLGEIAENAVRTADWLKDHPRPLDAAAIESIYEESF
jgi:alcohol dehydrogenase